MEQVFVQLQCCQLKSFDTEVYCSFANPISVLIFDFMHIRVSSANLFLYNNIYNHESVCGAVIMTKVIARVHPVHLMNVD